MRIKSYFAPSVQSAISLARHEFGDDVTLVTSHVAPAEARHLGEYEVVFAIEEPAAKSAAPEPEPAAPAFQDLVRDAITAKPASHEDLAHKLEHLRSCLIEIGIESSLVQALMTFVERSVSYSPASTNVMPPVLQIETASESSMITTRVVNATPDQQLSPVESEPVVETASGCEKQPISGLQSQAPAAGRAKDSIDPGLLACFSGSGQKPALQQATTPSLTTIAKANTSRRTNLTEGTEKTLQPALTEETIDSSLLAAFSGSAYRPPEEKKSPLILAVDEIPSPDTPKKAGTAWQRPAQRKPRGLVMTAAAAGLCTFGQWLKSS